MNEQLVARRCAPFGISVVTKLRPAAGGGVRPVLYGIGNPTRSRVVSCVQFEYLGFSFAGVKGTIQVSAKSTQKFKHRIRELTGRSRGICAPENNGADQNGDARC